MSEDFIRKMAERFGLSVLKRVTTGTDKAGFATFELSGPHDKLAEAMPVLQEKAPPFANMRGTNNPEHPDHGKTYIEIHSVWFQTSKPGVSL